MALRGDLSSFDDPLLQELAGNAMTFPVVLALLMSTFAAVPWGTVTEVVPPSTDVEVQRAMDLLESLPECVGSGKRAAVTRSTSSAATAAAAMRLAKKPKV